MDNADDAINKDQFARHNGIEIIEAGEGRARARMRLCPDHLNGLGMVHGGAIFSLADYAFAAACNSQGVVSVAVNGSISYIKAASGGELVAEAEEVQQDGKLGSCVVRVLDEEGDVVAMFQGLSYRKGPRWSEA